MITPNFVEVWEDSLPQTLRQSLSQTRRILDRRIPLTLRRSLSQSQRILTYRYILSLFEILFPIEFQEVCLTHDLIEYQENFTPEEMAFLKAFPKEMVENIFPDYFIQDLEENINFFSSSCVNYYSLGFSLSCMEDYGFTVQILLSMIVCGYNFEDNHQYYCGNMAWKEWVESISQGAEEAFVAVDLSPLVQGDVAEAFDLDPSGYQLQFRQFEPPLQYFADAIEVVHNFSDNSLLFDPEMELSWDFGWNHEDLTQLFRQYQEANTVLSKMGELIDWLNSHPAENFDRLFAEWRRIYRHHAVSTLPPLLQLLESYREQTTC